MSETDTTLSAQLDATRAALKDACDLLEGWVLTKCPARYRGEHMQHIQRLRVAGAISEPMRGLYGFPIPPAPPRPRGAA